MTTPQTTFQPQRFAIAVPDLGQGAECVVVSAWLVDVGQFVVAGDRVAEVLLPGITFDIESQRTGFLCEILKPVDAAAESGDVLGWVEVQEDSPA